MKFRKIAAVLTGALMLSSSVAFAAAANYSAPFVQNGNADVAIVYGSTAASSDMAAALNIQSDLATKLAAQNTVSGGSTSATGGVVEDEIALGGGIVSGKIKATSTDSEVPSLLDSKFSWDDGSGSDDYNVHEELVITNASVTVKTSLNDNDLKGVALANDKGLEYKFVFDDSLNTSAIDTDDADTLYLDILGKSYEVQAMDNTSITLVTSAEKALGPGQSYTVNGTTITVDNVFENSVQVNGEIISNGATKKINGLRVEVSDIGYHSNSPETSVAILKIGEDISKTYNSGDEYVGEDEDDPTWIWDISSPGYANGYIGVKYDHKDTRAKDDVKYVGESYVFPENFAQVKLVGTTAVSYDDFTVSFDDSLDLFNSTETDSTATTQDAKVVMIEGPEKDSLTTSTGSYETNTLYLRFASNTAGTEANASRGAIEVFYKDVDADISGVKPRYAGKVDLVTDANVSSTTVATLTNGDTDLDVDVSVAGGYANLTIGNVEIALGGTAITNTTGTFEWLGGHTEADSKENAETTDVVVSGTSVGTEDNDVMDTYGTIVKTPNSNADNDVVELSVPSEQVYAEVAVLGNGGSVSSSDGAVTALGSIAVKDTEVSSVSSKNLIVVGGNCVNTVAASLLGVSAGATCSTDFTAKTGVVGGQFLIQTFASPYSASKVATLVAGMTAADTTKAAKYLTTQTVDTTVGKKYKGTSETVATLETVTA